MDGGGGALLGKVFSQIHFFQEELYPPLYTFLLVKLVHVLWKAISMSKALNMKCVPNNKMPY